MFEVTRSKASLVLHDVKVNRGAYILTAITSFGGMLFGWDTGLIGGVLTVKSFQESFGIKTDTPAQQKAFSDLSGNIVSVLQAGCFFGAMASFYASDCFGRKFALIFADIMFLAGSTMQTCSAINTTSLGLLYAGRVIGGFGVGLISAVVPTYIGENVNKEIRGRCIGTMQLFNVTGIMLSYFVNYGLIGSAVDGTDLQWRIPFALQMLPGVLLLLGLLTQKESPRWLVEKGKTERASQALSYVRRRSPEDPDVRRELDEIIEDFRGHENLSLLQQTKAAYSDRRTLYRVSLGVILMFWQQWTGTNSINYYSPQIFASIGLKGQTAGLFATGIYGVVKVVFTALGLLLATEQIGRKYSLMIGAAGQAFAMFYIGIHGAVSPETAGQGLTGASVFAIVSVYLFVVFYSFGWGPVPFVLAAECSPNHVRSLTMSLSLMTQWLFNFVIARTVPVMLSNITFGTFLLFGACSICCFLYAAIFIPETARVPLESIHKLFEGNIIRGAIRDNIPRYRQANYLVTDLEVTGDDDRVVKEPENSVVATHVERA
ncbi:MFS sugar transporter-like protein [Xylogone sp. PMI_703]|nr:MFS sugar transporter-like protein [Xylogone sp. PMI_703]